MQYASSLVKTSLCIEVKTGMRFALLDLILYSKRNASYGFDHRVDVKGLAAASSAASPAAAAGAGQANGRTFH
ncbi:hypothetical protein [Erwinia amylovora]|uniref:hypothetical protein n=1 Tax=Erwinia amylovora TaxID=552 RepID=UPI001E474B15|nr:hypothetical protein [Erwinia amylovora]